ncbi:MAG: hypothetical protein GXY84_02685 [Clostridiales bacterium]|nr:hypothetical protein [Clostridiales bacterium]
MMFRKRLRRTMEWTSARRAQREEDSQDSRTEALPVEKGDLAAMTLSALALFLPIALLVLVVMVLVAGIWFWI